MKNENKGITLIALIITIIVMLILAGVTIKIIVNGGLFDQARNAKEKTKIAMYQEEIESELANKQIERLGQLKLQDLIDERYVNEHGEIEKDGYLYKIDESLKVTPMGKITISIEITPNGAGGEQIAVTVIVKSSEAKIDENNLYYAWNTNKKDEPEEWLKFINGEPLPIQDIRGSTVQHFLWIKANDVAGNTRMITSKPYFDTDNESPSIVFQEKTKTDSSQIISVTVTDDRSGVVEVEKPDGIKIELSNLLTYTFDYEATSNGTITFKAKDAAGNTSTKSIEISGIVETIYGTNGIVADIRDMDIQDGTYFLVENGTTYKITLKNFYEDEDYTSSPTIAAIEDGPMVILKYHKNLTIGSGVTLQPSIRTKGMYVCVKGTLENKGVITMTERGASAEGQDVYLYKNSDETWEFVPKTGASGGVEVSAYTDSVTKTASARGKNRLKWGWETNWRRR